MNKVKYYNCKVGTIPSEIVLKHNYKIEIGKFIYFRHSFMANKYHQGVITQVNNDGYFFVELI